MLRRMNCGGIYAAYNRIYDIARIARGKKQKV